MAFRDTRFLVTLLSEDTKSYYTTRRLELQNIQVGHSITQCGELPAKGGEGEVKFRGFTPKICPYSLMTHIIIMFCFFIRFLQSFSPTQTKVLQCGGGKMSMENVNEVQTMQESSLIGFK